MNESALVISFQIAKLRQWSNESSEWGWWFPGQMAVFLINNCTFNGCGLSFTTLAELIQHIEESHIGICMVWCIFLVSVFNLHLIFWSELVWQLRCDGQMTSFWETPLLSRPFLVMFITTRAWWAIAEIVCSTSKTSCGCKVHMITDVHHCFFWDSSISVD